MSDLDTFLNDAKKRGQMTLHDHLILSGFTDDYQRYRSMAAQVQRAIREGGPHNNMLGTVITPSARKGRGRPPKWAGATVAQEDKQTPLKDIEFLGSTAMVAVTDSMMTANLSEEARELVHDAQRTLARQSNKAQLAAMDAIQPFSDEIIRLNATIEEKNEVIAAKDETIRAERAAREQLQMALRANEALIKIVTVKLGVEMEDGTGSSSLVAAAA